MIPCQKSKSLNSIVNSAQGANIVSEGEGDNAPLAPPGYVTVVYDHTWAKV